jgi:hypothetical protein
MNRSPLRSLRSLLAFVVALLALSPAVTRALDTAMGDSACAVLKAVLPKVKGFEPVPAKAQLVMAMADKFDYDGKKLKQLQVEVDASASAKCPKERDAWWLSLARSPLRRLFASQAGWLTVSPNPAFAA